MCLLYSVIWGLIIHNGNKNQKLKSEIKKIFQIDELLRNKFTRHDGNIRNYLSHK